MIPGSARALARSGPSGYLGKIWRSLLENGQAFARNHRELIDRSAPVLIFLMLAMLSIGALLTGSEITLAHHIFRYLFLIPIVLAGYLYGRGAAMVVTLVPLALFLPLCVRLLVDNDPDAGKLLVPLLLFPSAGVLTAYLASIARQYRKVIYALEGMGPVIEKSLDTKNLLPAILQHCVQLVDAQGGEILITRKGTESLTTLDEQGVLRQEENPTHGETFRNSLLRWLLAQKQPVALPDLSDDPRFFTRGRFAGRRTSIASVPLSRSGKPIGVIVVWRSKGSPFQPKELDLLRVIADKSELVVENAWLYSQTDQVLSRKAQELAILLDASATFASASGLDQLERRLAQKLAQSVESTCSRICLIENGCLVTHAGCWIAESGPWNDEVGRGELLSALPFYTRVMQQGEPVIVREEDRSVKLTPAERAHIFAGGTKSALIVPLNTKGSSLGVAILGERRSWTRTPFTSEKIDLCRGLAKQGTLAIENWRAFESLADQTQRTRLIIDNVADGVMSADLDGRITAFNPAAEQITGLRAVDVIGRLCDETLHWDSTLGCASCGNECPLSQAVLSERQGRAVQRKEWFTRSDGTRVWMAHSTAALVDPSGKVSGTVSVLRDVSREEELIRLKNEFISLVSHQLRTPLANIRTSVELLAHADLEAPQAKNMLNTLSRQATRLSRLADQVLEASRLERGEIQLDLEPLALWPLLEETVELYRTQFRNYGFVLRVDPRTPFAVGDRSAVEVVLDNLLQNAVNYSQEGSIVRVETGVSKDGPFISVQDQGPGIPREELDAVFDRFRRLPNRDSHKPKGFGLGLYICKMLVQAQGGRIWVESEPGHGSTFYFTLRPVEDLDEKDPGR